MKLKIKTTHRPTRTPVLFEVEIGDDIVEAVKMFGNETVFNCFIKGVRLAFVCRANQICTNRNNIPSLEEFKAIMNRWTPETIEENRVGKHRAQLKELLNSDEELAKIRASLDEILGKTE